MSYPSNQFLVMLEWGSNFLKFLANNEKEMSKVIADNDTTFTFGKPWA